MRYRCACIPGGSIFFTVVTAQRLRDALVRRT